MPSPNVEVVRRWLESRDESDIEAVIDLGDHVVLFQRQRGALSVRLSDGKIVDHRPHTDRAEALQHAGLADAESWRVGIETVLVGYEAWNKRDVEALMNLMEPDSEFVPIWQSIMPAFTGPAGMREFFESSADVWEEFVFTPLAFEIVGDAVLVELEARGKARGSGIELEEHWAHVFTQNQGRLRRFSAYSSVDEARTGLSYPDAE